MQSCAVVQGLAFACVLSVLAGCEEKKPMPPATASTGIAAAPVPIPSAAPVAPPAAEKPARPSKVDIELTPARRSTIEAKYSSAKGFVDAAELETKLKANKALKDKKSAVAAFDRAAQGKWLLFSGPLVNLTDDGFDLGIVYTPQLPNDPMGMSRQFFEITLSNIEGYGKEAFRTGNVVVVLAKYSGAGKAGPGQELIATGDWQ